jgi:hypothetical protein
MSLEKVIGKCEVPRLTSGLTNSRPRGVKTEHWQERDQGELGRPWSCSSQPGQGVVRSRKRREQAGFGLAEVCQRTAAQASRLLLLQLLGAQHG